ncbi:MAG: hypothetical protein AB9869_00990 [Verrucomicrobiia bacterium]
MAEASALLRQAFAASAQKDSANEALLSPVNLASNNPDFFVGASLRHRTALGPPGVVSACPFSSSS